jgi:hypothetical protein
MSLQIKSNVVGTYSLTPIAPANDCDEELRLRIEIHQKAAAAEPIFFAIIWRLETYVVEPRFFENGFEGGKCEHEQLVVDDFFTELVGGIRAKIKELLLAKVLKEINDRLFPEAGASQ